MSDLPERLQRLAYDLGEPTLADLIQVHNGRIKIIVPNAQMIGLARFAADERRERMAEEMDRLDAEIDALDSMFAEIADHDTAADGDTDTTDPSSASE